MTDYHFVNIERNGDQWVTSYDVWAKLNAYPLEEGDGVFVGNATISPSEDATSIALARSVDETWLFAAISIYGRDKGIFYQLNGT
jgi:hypothetical protein